MNRIIMLFVASLVIFHNADARITYEIARNGAQAKVVIQVEDQDGVAVQGAKIWGAFTTGSGFNDYAMIEGLTNNEGKFVAQGRCNELLRVDITKDGYYSSELKVNFWQSKVDPIVVDGKWQPYGETRVVTLKRIKNLGRLVVPDMSRRVRIDLKIPEFENWIPFDLEKYDWVEPYGEGKCSDVLLRFRSRRAKHWYDYTDCMEICFTNTPYAGAYEMKKDMSSDLHTIYCADPNADYKNFFEFKSEQTIDRKKTNDYLKDDSYFVYRIRTKVDEEGNLKSAHYGIISGKWMSNDKSMTMSDGCFNPKDNNFNIEDGYYLRQEVQHYKD